MEWLRNLLESAKIDDGKLDIDGLMKSINAEFPKNAVPKATFNDVNEQLKTANITITDLKKNNKDNETLQAAIKTHETTIENLKAEADKQNKTYTLKEKLKELGVTDVDYLIYKHGGVDKFNFDKEGKLIGLEDAINPYKESISHIFKQEEKQPQFTGIKPVEGTVTSQGYNPWKKETFNLTDQGKLFKENPDLAKQLMSQVNQ